MTRGPVLLLGWVVAAALASTCSRAPTEVPPDGYAGTMRPGCAPHDAPSTEIRLEADEGLAEVFFNLWPSAGIDLPAEVRFDAAHPAGQGAYCYEPETCQPAEWGEVMFEAPSDQGTVRGTWTLGMSDGRVLRGTFEAEWLAIAAMCG